MKNQIEIYKTADKQISLEVRFKQDTVWLNQDQLSLLFQRDQSVISRHICNVFKERELEEKSNMQKMHITGVDKPVIYYSLDVIISVGYRVKSVRGTQFRQWATKRLKEYLVEGYSINQKRLAERNFEVRHLKTGISIIRRALEDKAGLQDEAGELARLLERFSNGLSLLDDYDHAGLDAKGKTGRKAIVIKTNEYRKLVTAMKGDFASDLFGREKDSGFESSVMQIYQSFDGKEVYPTLEEKSAMLLYFIVKNHSFVDGNKRIAAACFLYFLNRNKLLFDKNNLPRIDNKTLAALTLFVAVSKPEEMPTVKQVVISMLNRK